MMERGCIDGGLGEKSPLVRVKNMKRKTATISILLTRGVKIAPMVEVQYKETSSSVKEPTARSWDIRRC